jgi:hypothetical protein
MPTISISATRSPLIVAADDRDIGGGASLVERGFAVAVR